MQTTGQISCENKINIFVNNIDKYKKHQRRYLENDQKEEK